MAETSSRENTVSSIKDRQRAAARARLEKEMAERSTAARNRRRRQAIIGSALAVVVIAGVAFWAVTALKDDKDKSDTSAAPAAGTVACSWTPADAAAGGKVKDVGTPPTTVPNVGSSKLTFDTNLGPITATIDLTKAPCTGASFKHLASKDYLKDSKCHRLVNKDQFRVLQCGDPFAVGKGYRETDGTGGPSYTMPEENLPTSEAKPYPAGSIAMANTGQPNSTGSQFFICAEDTMLQPNYTLVGSISEGMDIVKEIVKAGDDKAFEPQPGGGHPKKELVIKGMTIA